jgi:hypothetical protein
MIFVAVGPPSPLCQWGVHLLRTILEISLGPINVITSNRIDDFRTTWGEGSEAHPHSLLFFDNPDASIVAILKRCDTPIVAFVEDPAEIAGYALVERGIDWKSAIRLTSLVLATLHDLYLSPKILLIRRDSELRIIDLIRSIAKHLKITLTEEQECVVLDRVSPGATVNKEVTVEMGILAALPAAKPIGQISEIMFEGGDGRSVCEAVFEPFRKLAQGAKLSYMKWPWELFAFLRYRSTEVEDMPMLEIDMLGPARNFFFGPWLHLPTGAWTIDLNFSIFENISGNQFEIDIYNGNFLARARGEIPKFGVFQTKIHFAVDEPSKPIELRLWMCEGAIEGRVKLNAVEVFRTEEVDARPPKQVAASPSG